MYSSTQRITSIVFSKLKLFTIFALQTVMECLYVKVAKNVIWMVSVKGYKIVLYLRDVNKSQYFMNTPMIKSENKVIGSTII